MIRASLRPLPIAAALAAALAGAAPAGAADLRPDETAPVEATRWSGPWAGLFAGGGSFAGGGAFGGAAAGYAAQFGRLVIGAEGEIAGADLDARRAGGRYEIDAAGAIRARVGYAFDRFVAFGTAGVAFASAEFARGGERDRAFQVGWTVGGGVEVAITGALSARAEYLYVDLDRTAFDAGGGVSIGPSGGLARLGLNYRF